MIQKLQKLSHLLKNNQKIPATYNASLPILIRVIQKLKGDMYLLQIGAQQMQTKSHKALIVGERYWGEMGRSSLGHITLHNLIMQPKILDFFHNAPLKFTLQDLQDLGEQSDIFEGFKDFIVHKLAQANSKEEFLFLSNILLGLKSGVLSLMINEKDEVLQIKKYDSNKVRFSVVMPLLGIVSGEIGIYEGGNTLDIKVLYETTKAMLEKNLNMLKGFKVSKISVDTNLLPLYEFKESLLDVRG